MLGSLMDQPTTTPFTGLPAASFGWAVMVMAWPAMIVAEPGESVTLATVGVGGVTSPPPPPPQAAAATSMTEVASRTVPLAVAQPSFIRLTAIYRMGMIVVA